ncbi:unnamed protein product [Merluccius merluccius]
MVALIASGPHKRGITERREEVVYDNRAGQYSQPGAAQQIEGVDNGDLPRGDSALTRKGFQRGSPAPWPQQSATLQQNNHITKRLAHE